MALCHPRSKPGAGNTTEAMEDTAIPATAPADTRYPAAAMALISTFETANATQPEQCPGAFRTGRSITTGIEPWSDGHQREAERRLRLVYLASDLLDDCSQLALDAMEPRLVGVEADVANQVSFGRGHDQPITAKAEALHVRMAGRFITWRPPPARAMPQGNFLPEMRLYPRSGRPNPVDMICNLRLTGN